MPNQRILFGLCLICMSNCTQATSFKEHGITSQDADHRPNDVVGATIPNYDLRNYGEYPEERWITWSDPQLGTLNLTNDWFNLIFRPFNLMPWPRDQIKTKFSLHTREVPNKNATIGNWTYLYANNTKTITDSTFKASRPTKIFTHGFMATGYEEWFQNITAALLINGDYNVIVTHWGPGSGTNLLDLIQAFGNIRVVGLEIAYLVNTLVNVTGVKANDVHLIGHSLGSHTSGYAGQRIPNLGRITGLDPSRPGFESMDPVVRLDPSDALFVDNYHTAGDGLIFGTFQPMGHLDFYVNGGQYQPGCFIDGLCSHLRALTLYRDSLISTCQAIAYECSDYGTFVQGNCYSCGSDNNQCAPVGMKANLYPNKARTNVKLYYTTTDTSPFCQYQYAVQTTVADSSSPASANVYGKMSVNVNGNLKASLVPLEGSATFTRGKETSLLMTSLVDLGKIKNVTLTWNPASDFFNWIYCIFNNCNLYITNVTISAMNRYPESDRLDNTVTACLSGSSVKYVTIQPTANVALTVGSCQ